MSGRSVRHKREPPSESATAGRKASEVFDDFTKAGVKPTAGAVSGKKWVQALESLLSRTPGSEGRVREALTETFDGLKVKLKKLLKYTTHLKGLLAGLALIRNLQAKVYCEALSRAKINLNSAEMNCSTN